MVRILKENRLTLEFSDNDYKLMEEFVKKVATTKKTPSFTKSIVLHKDEIELFTSISNEIENNDCKGSS